MLPWLLNEGKETFVTEFLDPLGAKFLATQRIRVVNAATIMVNLGLSPRLLFDMAKVKSHIGGGWIKVQKRRDGLYVAGRKVVFFLAERQKGVNPLKGYELLDELTGKSVLNANILDALYEHPELIPEDWKRDEAGNIHVIYFWGSIYGYTGTDRLFVRCFCFHDGSWKRDYNWLDNDFLGRRPAALLAS